jgi:hypothetical protein
LVKEKGDPWSPESHNAESEVVEWVPELQTHLTVSLVLMITEEGEKSKFSIVILVDAA